MAKHKIPQRPLPVTEDHLKAIGLVVVESSVLELYLQLTYCLLHKMDEAARREKATLIPTARLLEQIRTDARRLLPSKEADLLSKILMPFGALISERHDIVHGIWITADDGRVGVAAFRGGTRVGGRGMEYPPTKILALVDRIRVSNYEIQEFLRPRGGFAYIGVSLPETTT